MTDIILPKLDQTGDNEWADVQDNDLAIRDVVNGKLDNNNLRTGAGITADKLDPALLEEMGAGSGLRGKSIIPAEESRTGTGYGMLPTPDRVPGLTLPQDGLFVVRFDAKVKSSVAGAGRVALHLNETQLRTRTNGQLAQIESAPTRATEPGTFCTVLTTSFGLVSSLAGVGITPDVTTGQTWGISYAEPFTMRYDIQNTIREVTGLATGVCLIWAAAGIYDISVRYLASSGSISAKERKLLVSTEGFS